MEVTQASWGALGLVLVTITAKWAWSVVDWLWLKPKKLERCLREQGLQGNSYRLFHGDMKENAIMLAKAKSKPMILSTSHDIASRFIPFLDQALKTYGTNSFIWDGPTPRVNIMDPEDVKDIFTKLDDFRKPSSPLIRLLITGLAIIGDEKWVKHRRIINPTFHVERLKCMLPAFHKSCDEMIKDWESRVSTEQGLSSEFDVWPSIQKLTSDAISRTAFGSSYLEGRKIFKLIKEQTALTIKSVQGAYIPGWRFLPTKMDLRMKQIDKELTSLLKDIINKREKSIKAGEATKDDLLGALMESNFREIKESGKNDKNVGMSIEDVIAECKLFYYAGQESTSVLLIWTVVLLGHNQIWQDRAREEVMQVFGSHKPDFDGLNHLKVVNMILLEVLRLYPALVVLSRVTNKPMKLKKFSLPAGVEVGISTLHVHRDKELWGDDADEFKPERFSEGVSRATKSPFSFIPFGAGPRICIGQNFTMTEAKLTVALILQHFTFEVSPSYEHAPAAPMIKPQYGVPIILHKR